MKTVNLTEEEHASLLALRAKKTAKATDTESSDVVRAAGTSEGAKKGWEARVSGAHDLSNAANEASNKLSTMTGGQKLNHHFTAGNAHLQARAAHRKLAEDASNDGMHAQSGYHQHLGEYHNMKWQQHMSDVDRLTKASDATSTDIIHCRSHSAMGPVLATDKPWSPGEPVEFMWMPAGVHTICAGFRKGSIELTVNCDQSTADAVQSSLDAWREERPKQEPFGCIEHKEQEASFRVGATCGFKWNQDGVYLAAEPTTLGAQNVNGKVHRSWSPSFTTDADYSKATERNGVLLFPEGVRGSRSNPAQITGVDFCVGTLTNKPAFHAMSPVKAKESVNAHCKNTLMQDVPDATPEEVSCYEACVDNGGSHIDAVANIKAKRKPEFKPAKAAEKVTSDTIAARQSSALEQANKIAAKHGVTKLSLEDVYEKCTVTATGTSEGAAKGWQKRGRFSKQEAFDVFNKTVGSSSSTDMAEKLARIENPTHDHVSDIVRKEWGPHISLKIEQNFHRKMASAKATDATPQDILNRIYARAGANR